jgi:hypothetical protein
MITARRLFSVAALGLVALLAAHAFTAYTASNSVPTTQLGNTSSTVLANNLKPPECTMTVTSVLAGAGTFSATAQFQLVLGSGSRDVVTLQKNDCFVGGGPTIAPRDSVTGPSPGGSNGDQCIVTSGATVTRCTIVATRP